MNSAESSLLQTENVPVITIDGPSGTGKGTLCRLLAQELKWHRLDSGCLYRALAYQAILNQIDIQDVETLISLAHNMDICFKTDEDQQDYIMMNDKDVSDALRTETCGMQASTIAVIPEVRTALLLRQRAFARSPGLVTDGRDMGTVVFPEAVLKIYLHASPTERATRRYLELKEKGFNASLAKVVEDSIKRDAQDSTREHAPLKPAGDAVLIDTTGLTITQMYDTVLHLVKKRLLRC